MKGLLNSKICLTLAVIFFLADNGHGAPAKGRYMWVKCNPDTNNANCATQRGPLMDLPGPPDRLPSIAVKDIVPEEAVFPPNINMDHALPPAQELKEDHLFL
uniref:Serglycin n=1 Tax=Salmo salar TaxID=8030 RepID=B5XE65_SALSA|nr:Serglycin precursor [Salmo salar]ADM16087.1 Serglycin precursor [Salmo salar]